jgi:drug/metabolite transporter (DMT)-like permease
MLSNLSLVAALVLWGIWGLLHKQAVDRSHPLTVEWMNCAPYVVLIPVWFALGRRAAPATNLDPKVFGLAVAGALCGMIATLCVLFALRDRPASLVIAVTSGYPMVTFLLALATGVESWNPGRAAGIALIIAGIAVLTLGAGKTA